MALYRPELWVQSGYPGDYTCTFKTAFYVESDPGAVTQVIISRNWNGAAEGIVLYYDNTADQMSVVWFTGGGSTFEQAVLGSRPSINQQCIAYLQSSSTTVKGGWAPISSPTSWTSNQTPNPLPAHGSNNAINLTSNANGAYMTAQNWCGWNELLSESTLSGEIYSAAVYRTNLVFEHKLNDGDVTSPWTDTSGNGNTATQQGGLAPTNRTNFLADYGVGTLAQLTELNSLQRIAPLNLADFGDLFIFGDDGFESSMGGLKVFGGFRASGTSATIGQVAETDQAQALTQRQAKSIGQVVENNTPQALTVVRRIAIAQIVETDAAQAVASRQAKAIGQAAELDAPQSLASPQAKAVGQVAELDAAQAVASAQARAVAQVVETDAAQAVTLGASGSALGQVVENDAAQGLASPQRRAVGQIVETDAAQGLAAMQARAIGQAAELDAATALTQRQARLIGQAQELDSATAVTSAGALQLAQQQELDAAQPMAAAQRRAIGQPVETDAAQPVARVLSRTVGQVVETDAAQAVQMRLLWQIGLQIEVDEAWPVTVGGIAAPSVQGRRSASTANTLRRSGVSPVTRRSGTAQLRRN